MTALPSTEDLARLAKENYYDPQYLAALGLMIVTGRAATSLVQRALGIGYNNAARIVERIEADGIISRPNSAGKREVVLDRREAEATSQAARDVLAERQRQVSVEGWDDIHDDCNDKSELAQAAACYALSGTPADEAVFIHGRWKDPRDLFWPWDRAWWKPTNRRRDLVKAGALILAEIERLDRATPTTEASHGE